MLNNNQSAKQQPSAKSDAPAEVKPVPKTPSDEFRSEVVAAFKAGDHRLHGILHSVQMKLDALHVALDVAISEVTGDAKGSLEKLKAVL